MLWSPGRARVERATITRFADWARENRGAPADPSYDALWRWSVENLEVFWESIWTYFDVRSSTPYDAVLSSREMPGARWFAGARVNYAAHLLRDRPADGLAIQSAGEASEVRQLSWGELEDAVARVAHGLRALGVQPGDRVAAYMPNLPEAVVAFLASAAVGAVFSSCSPEFGAAAVLDRLAQTAPVVLIAVDGYRYNGKVYDRRGVVEEIRAGLPSVRGLVLLEHLGLGSVADSLTWLEFTRSVAPLEPESVPFEHPLWILFSSGTTGLPKAIVHSHGGILLEMLKTHHLHHDAHTADRAFWFTTTSWMMWNHLIGALLTGASIVLYDGNPGYPSVDRLWDLAAQTGTTSFGTSPAYLDACRRAGVQLRHERDLARVRTVGVTGSPLDADGFRWIYDELGDIWLAPSSGGTDVSAAFVGGVPTLPVHAGEIQARMLGVNVESWDSGRRAIVGEVGELVVTEPMPSMPIGFWGDADGSRYRDTYFSTFPGVWRHGDWIEITEHGGAIIRGRSDATINRGGVRMGTSEIYRAVLADERVVDALVIDLPRPGTAGWMPLFVVLRDGAELDPSLRASIVACIRERCSPRHVPDLIVQVRAVPRTRTGKLLELPVKRLLMGEPEALTVSRDALLDPDALDDLVGYARETKELRSAAPGG